MEHVGPAAAMKRAIERHNMTRFTPVGADQASRALAHR
jgi:hypothetical protein